MRIPKHKTLNPKPLLKLNKNVLVNLKRGKRGEPGAESPFFGLQVMMIQEHYEGSSASSIARLEA